jgi:hypothetical protein
MHPCGNRQVFARRIVELPTGAMFAGFDGHGRGYRDAFEYLAGCRNELSVATISCSSGRRKAIEIPQRAEHDKRQATKSPAIRVSELLS